MGRPDATISVCSVHVTAPPASRTSSSPAAESHGDRETNSSQHVVPGGGHGGGDPGGPVVGISRGAYGQYLQGEELEDGADGDTGHRVAQDPARDPARIRIRQPLVELAYEIGVVRERIRRPISAGLGGT